MYKNQLQELAQRSCFNLPSYTSIREGPDHAPRFKVSVNFNGENFESPTYCSTLRQAEHSAAEVALNALASRGPSNSLAARILDETGVYKNLLQEVSQRVGASLPAYITFRTGLGHVPVFTCTVELAGIIFTGEPAKNKKQAEKNAAMAAWFSLKSLVQQSETPYEKIHKDEQEHVVVARALQKYLIKARLAKQSFPIKFPALNPRPSSLLPSPPTTSKILPLICPKIAPCHRPVTPARNSSALQTRIKPAQTKPISGVQNESNNLGPVDNSKLRSLMFPAAAASPYIPVLHCSSHNRLAPAVTIRNAIPVFSAPPRPSPPPSLVIRPQALGMAPPVCLRQAVPVFSPPGLMEELHKASSAIKSEDQWLCRTKTGRVEESFASKFPPFQAEDLKNPKLSSAPVSEVSSSQILTVSVEPPPPFKFIVSDVQAEESKIEEKSKPTEIRGLEDLKI